MAAILDFRLPVTSDSITIGPVELPDPKNMWLAFGISFLCVMDAEILLVKHVGKLQLTNLRFSRNLPNGKDFSSQEPSKIFGCRFRQNVRSCVGEEYLKAQN